MAAPGVGVGDLINACVFIYGLCVKYKDAPKEFDEIAEKAKATAVVLERLDAEALLTGNLVERAGLQAYDQLQANLSSLRRDSEKLEAIVTKYDKIHSEGPGRRMLFALKESNGLTDLRQRIGRHEQTLQLWYMTLVYGSLRRLEGGQEAAARRLEDLMSGINAIKRMGHKREDRIRKSLKRGDTSCLETELQQSGLSPQQVMDSLNVSANYVMVTPREQRDLEQDILDDLTEIRAKQPSTLSPPRPMPESLNPTDALPSRHRHEKKRYDVPSGPYSSPLNPPPPFDPLSPQMRYDASPQGVQTSYDISPETHFKHFKPEKLPYQYDSKGVGRPIFNDTARPSEKFPYQYDSKGVGRPIFKDNARSSPTVQRMRRSNSTSARRDYPEGPYIVVEETSSAQRDKDVDKLPQRPPPVLGGSGRQRHARIISGYPSMHGKEEVIIVPNDSSAARRARRSSEAPPAPSRRDQEYQTRSPRSPLLVVPDTGPRYRSSSAQRRDEASRPVIDEIIIEQRRTAPQLVHRARASSNASDRGNDDKKRGGSRERSSSTHSYTRVRPGSSDGGNGGGADDGSDRIRMVRKMDRIDSMGN